MVIEKWKKERCIGNVSECNTALRTFWPDGWGILMPTSAVRRVLILQKLVFLADLCVQSLARSN